MKTAEDVKAWMAGEHRAECMDNYRTSKDIPDFLRSPRTELLWMSGCWLNTVLGEMGATDKEIFDIGFCQGQQSVFRDPIKVAVEYANEYETNKKVKDQPGLNFADELNNRHIKVIP